MILLLSDQILILHAINDVFVLPFYLDYILGIPMLIIGLLFFIWGFSQLKPAAAIGFAKRLRATGAYALTRNPMYFGVNAMFWGFAFISGQLSVISGAFIWSVLNFLSVTLWEERQMAGKFGKEYREYQNRVPRFLPLKIRRKTRRSKKMMIDFNCKLSFLRDQVVYC